MTMILQTLGISSLNALLAAVVTLIVCLIGIDVLTKLTNKLIDKLNIDGTLKGFMRTAIKIALWALAIVIVAGAFGIPTASLVAVISIAGLALSLAVQDIMSNLFSGITLLLTHPFSAGDYVEFGGTAGVIDSIGLFYTVVNSLDNKVIHVPNKAVAGAQIVNYSKEPKRRVDMLFEASYDDATEDVKAAIMEVINAEAKILQDPAPFVKLNAYKDSSIQYVVRVWCNNADYWDVYFGLNENVRESFAKNGIRMTYNHVNVHMVQ